MKKKLLALMLLSLIFISNLAHANWFQDIIDNASRIGRLTNGYLGQINSLQDQMLSGQNSLLDTNKDIKGLMDEVHGSVSGTNNLGTSDFTDYQSYGKSAADWQGLINMIATGRHSGALGESLRSVSNEFQLDNNAFNQSNAHKLQKKYYTAQSQTIIASRAASQLDYNQIQKQIDYQHLLQQKINHAATLKESVDLSNRIKVEANLINLELLREAALSNEQQALTSQGEVNGAVMNAKFLSN